MSEPIGRVHIDRALNAASTTRYVDVGQHLLPRSGDALASWFPGHLALVVADETTFAIAGAPVQESIARTNLAVGSPMILEADPVVHADYRHVTAIRAAIATAREIAPERPVLPVAVGSGTLNDLVKRAAFELDLPYAVVATAASMDGYTASGAALMKDGVKQTLACPAPVAVLADTEILRNAPPSMTASGYGDLIGKITAGADWIVADAVGVEPIIPDVWEMVQGPIRPVIAAPNRLTAKDPKAIEHLFLGLILTGLAIQATGSSRPASGSEHQFSHLWEMRGLEHDGHIVSHGFKVALGAIASTALYEALLAFPVDQMDPDDVVRTWPSWVDVATRIRATTDDPVLAAYALQEVRAKHIERDQLAIRLAALRVQWPELRSRLREQLLPIDRLVTLLDTAGCPTAPEHIGLSREHLRQSYAAARLIRRRYTVFDFVTELGQFPRQVEAIFAPDGFWASVPAPLSAPS